MSSFRFSGGNCCCCPNLYGYDAALSLFSIRVGGTYPNVSVHKEFTYGRARHIAVDSKNKKLVYQTNDIAVPPAIYIADLPKKNASQVILSPGGYLAFGLCCDYVSKRIFYSTYDNFGLSTSQIRVVNYDGTNDRQVAVEDGAEEPTPRSAPGDLLTPNWLSYDPVNDTLYYIVSFTSNSHWISKLKSVDSGGVISTIVRRDVDSTPYPAGSLSNQFWSLDYSAKHKELIYSEVGSYDPASTDQRSTIGIAKLDGTEQTLITSYRDVGANRRRLHSAQYNEKDNGIYFVERPFPEPLTTFALTRADYDGTNEAKRVNSRQIVDSTGIGLPIIGFSGQFFEIEFGCKWELFGDQYNGPG